MVWSLPRRFLNYERDPLRQENEEEIGRESIPKDESVKQGRERDGNSTDGCREKGSHGNEI